MSLRIQYPICKMCRYLNVSPSAYYQWRNRKKTKRELENDLILNEIRKIHSDKMKETYGVIRLQRELSDLGYEVTKYRVRKIMKVNGIRAVVRKKKFRYPKDSKTKLPVAENILDRNFVAESENEKWVSDITYIPTRHGWLYLCVVLDLYSRKIVGWSMNNNMKTGLVLSALNMATNLRGINKGLIFHSDRGSQYRSHNFRDKISSHGFIQSMSRKGNCWDNACAEAFFKTIKTEVLNGKIFNTLEEAKICIFEYIEIFYNRERRHSFIDYMSPEEFEKKGSKCA